MLKHPRSATANELSGQCSISITEIHGYIRGLKTEFAMRIQYFQLYGPLFSFLIKPESFIVQPDLSYFNWLNTEGMEMQLNELKARLWGKKVCRTMTAAGNRSCAWSRSLHFHLLGITTRELSQELCTVHIINVWCERSNMQSGCNSPPHQLRSRFSRLQNVHTYGSELAYRCAHFPVKSVFNKSQLLLLKWRTPVSDPVLCARNVYKWDHYLVFTKVTVSLWSWFLFFNKGC